MKGIAEIYLQVRGLSTTPLLGWLLMAGFMLALAPGLAMAAKVPAPGAVGSITRGSLLGIDEEGRPAKDCPLKHTDVKAEISGFVARVSVTQLFENTLPDKIEAVYAFPLPQGAAVDAMTMTVGDRIVKAKIKPREEAQALYDAARSRGHVAGLLNQERPNIFTQSVANILPGERVTVMISYVEILKYEHGNYELVYPMVVGPRYLPDGQSVPDAARIISPIVHPGRRGGHDISIQVMLDAGLRVDAVRSTTHDVTVDQSEKSRAVVRLRNHTEIPNKDFILTYHVAGERMADAVLTHRQGHEGFFTLFLQPPGHLSPEDITPKELVFVLDTSGSMSGLPIEKAKETIKLALAGLNPLDTFNLITFSGDTHILFPKPVRATVDNLRRAQAFLESRSGSGGTEMMKAIRAALEPSDDQDHVRVVCFMTDGYVGNDMEILSEVQKHPNARVFSFGIGSSVNRFLLDKMAEYGRGEVEYVGLGDDGSAAARRFHERMRNPLLTDIAIDWGGLRVTDVLPGRIPDLFSAKPVVVTGRYTAAGSGVVRLSGRSAGRYVVHELSVTLPEEERQHDVLATFWARRRVDDLMGSDFLGMQQGRPRAEVRKAILQLGLEHRLMTQFTALVAVEEMTVTDGGEPRRVDVPIEIPEGVSYEGVFGIGEAGFQAFNGASPPAIMSMTAPPSWSGSPRGAEAMHRMDPQKGKLDPSLAAVIERLRKRQSAPLPGETQFMRNGKAEVQIWLKDTLPETIARLKTTGAEIVAQPKTGRIVLARIPLDKLVAVADLSIVIYLAPRRGTS